MGWLPDQPGSRADRAGPIGLNTNLFLAAAERAGQPVEYHARDRFDHGYYFIQTFVHEHMAFHAQRLIA